ncbi:MAG: substrate-binding domain-containing protein, partial [Lachnospiraceae bacterium]|nr:substrate-binding domain-containing protein [Lachnospiraceae bacterium]
TTEPSPGSPDSLRLYRNIVRITYPFIFLALFFAITYKRDYSFGQKEDARLIGASYMTMNNEFFKIINEQIRVRVEAEGDMMILRDPGLDVVRQNRQIEEMLDMGISALIVTPVDIDGLTDVLRRAKSMGVYVIVVDSNISDETLTDCTIVSDNYNAGTVIANYVLDKQDGGRIVVFTHDATASGSNRVAGFMDTVAGHPDYEVLDMIECEGQYEIAMPRMLDYLDGGRDFDTVFCLNDLAAAGVVAALKTKGLAGKVNVYGVDASPDAKSLIDEGLMKASAVQFPTRIGERAASVLYEIFAGNDTEKTIIVPVDIVSVENIDSYNKERWQ